MKDRITGLPMQKFLFNFARLKYTIPQNIYEVKVLK